MNLIIDERSVISTPRASRLRMQGGEEEKCWSGMSRSGVAWRVMQGDSSTVIGTLPGESVNCVVTSPPYYWLRDYHVSGQIGLEATVEGYVKAVCTVMDQVRRVLRKDGTLFLNMGDTYYSGKGESQGKDKKSAKRRFGLRAVDKSGGMGIDLQRKSVIGIPWRVAIEMCRKGWILRSPIIWHRAACLPEPVVDRPRRSYEYVFMFVKGRRYFFNRQPLVDKKVEEDMWTIAPRPRAASGIGTAPYPDELVKRCLQIGCERGGLVLDPFLGSGTTARVALELNHEAIGIDLNRKFCLHATKLLRDL